MKLDTTAMILLTIMIMVNMLINGGPIATSILFSALAIVGALKQIRLTLEKKPNE